MRYSRGSEDRLPARRCIEPDARWDDDAVGGNGQHWFDATTRGSRDKCGGFFGGCDDGGMKTRLLAVLLAAAFVAPVSASVLYKSVDANGTVTFSDVPPPDGTRILEQRALGTSASGAATYFAPAPRATPTGLEEAFQMLDYDKALAEANARVDMAERGLAMARAAHATTSRPGLVRATLTLADHERVAFFKRDLKIARQQLMDVLRSRQLASGRPLQPGAPRPLQVASR